jgi:hypothetical protein
MAEFDDNYQPYTGHILGSWPNSEMNGKSENDHPIPLDGELLALD